MKLRDVILKNRMEILDYMEKYNEEVGNNPKFHAYPTHAYPTIKQMISNLKASIQDDQQFAKYIQDLENFVNQQSQRSESFKNRNYDFYKMAILALKSTL